LVREIFGRDFPACAVPRVVCKIGQFVDEFQACARSRRDSVESAVSAGARASTSQGLLRKAAARSALVNTAAAMVVAAAATSEIADAADDAVGQDEGGAKRE